MSQAKFPLRVMILSAGLGTRLRPLTDHTPKPLVSLKGRPMITYVLDLLDQHGCTEILLNIHHHADQMEAFVQEENARNKHRKIFLQDERAKLLGSGGAVARARPWLFAKHESALLLNADGIFHPDLSDFVATHLRLVREQSVACTLALMPSQEAGKKYTGLSVKGDLVSGIFLPSENSGNHQLAADSLLHFPGAYCLTKKAAERLPEEDCNIREELWRPLMKEKSLGYWLYQGDYLDLGTVADLQRAETTLERKKS